MRARVIKGDKVKSKTFGVLTVKEYFNKPGFEEMSVALIELDGVNTESFDERSNHFYCVVEGYGSFVLEGKETKVGKGDVIFISKGTKYFDKGKMKMLSFSHPRFIPSINR